MNQDVNYDNVLFIPNELNKLRQEDCLDYFLYFYEQSISYFVDIFISSIDVENVLLAKKEKNESEIDIILDFSRAYFEKEMAKIKDYMKINDVKTEWLLYHLIYLKAINSSEEYSNNNKRKEINSIIKDFIDNINLIDPLESINAINKINLLLHFSLIPRLIEVEKFFSSNPKLPNPYAYQACLYFFVKNALSKENFSLSPQSLKQYMNESLWKFTDEISILSEIISLNLFATSKKQPEDPNEDIDILDELSLQTKVLLNCYVMEDDEANNLVNEIQKVIIYFFANE